MTSDAIWVFVASFGVAACAGLAALLRTNAEITWKSAVSAVLNSGILGLGISLLWYTKYQDNIYFLVGICVIAGLGGATTIDFILDAVKKGGFSIKMGPNDSIKLDNKQEGKS